MNCIYFGIDNGISGSLAMITDRGSLLSFVRTPSFMAQDYTKKKKRISRIDTRLMREWISCQIQRLPDIQVRVFIERPMVNPMRFIPTTSALRALEATLITIERYDFPVRFVDSKEWQSVLLPSDCKGPEQLKSASRDIGIRMFPKAKEMINKVGDADSLLIAEHARRENW